MSAALTHLIAFLVSLGLSLHESCKDELKFSSACMYVCMYVWKSWLKKQLVRITRLYLWRHCYHSVLHLTMDSQIPVVAMTVVVTGMCMVIMLWFLARPPIRIDFSVPMRSVATQSRTAYRIHWKTPRFDFLCHSEDCAFPDVWEHAWGVPWLCELWRCQSRW